MLSQIPNDVLDIISSNAIAAVDDIGSKAFPAPMESFAAYLVNVIDTLDEKGFSAYRNRAVDVYRAAYVEENKRQRHLRAEFRKAYRAAKRNQPW